MSQIRIGLDYVPYFQNVVTPNRVEGFFGPAIVDSYTGIFKNINLTFVVVDKEEPTCADKGLCTSFVQMLQTGDIDLIKPVSSYKLGSLGANLTMMPFHVEETCHLMYKLRPKIIR